MAALLLQIALLNHPDWIGLYLVLVGLMVEHIILVDLSLVDDRWLWRSIHHVVLPILSEEVLLATVQGKLVLLLAVIV